MKSFILVSSLSLLITSCTTAYKMGQTPDDVYYSPERPAAEYVRAEKTEDRQYRNEERTTANDDYYSSEDRYLRMKVRNRSRWNYLDDPYYTYNPYSYRYYNNYYHYNSPWNNYSYWNYYYNPYAPHVIIVNPKSPTYNRPRTTNLNVFNNPPRQVTVNPNATENPKRPNANSNNSSRQRRDFGNDLRNVFGTDNNSSRTRTDNSSGSNRPSSSSSSSSSGSSGSSSSGGSSGGNAPVRRF